MTTKTKYTVSESANVGALLVRYRILRDGTCLSGVALSGNDKQDRETAELFAAAPELVEALRECERLLLSPDAEPYDADKVTAMVSALLARIEKE